MTHKQRIKRAMKQPQPRIKLQGNHMFYIIRNNAHDITNCVNDFISVANVYECERDRVIAEGRF